MKRKEAVVLAAEPDMKHGRDQPESSKGSRYCVYHDLHTHNTNECQELRAVREGRVGRCPERNGRGYDRGGARGGGQWDDRGHHQGWCAGLARIVGRISLARGLQGISLVRIARKATQDFLLCHHHQEGMKTIIRTRGLGASRSCVQSLASWAELKPQPRSVSSNSFLVK